MLKFLGVKGFKSATIFMVIMLVSSIWILTLLTSVIGNYEISNEVVETHIENEQLTMVQKQTVYFNLFKYTVKLSERTTQIELQDTIYV